MENSSMAKGQGHSNDSGDISSIVKVVQQGKAVISGEESVVIAVIIAAIKEKRVATFYVTLRARRRLWTNTGHPNAVKKLN